MANNTQDVELRIRATNYSKKTTTEVADALKDLVKAEEAQIEASKRGAATAADLEKGYQKIESAVKALLGQQSLTKLFQSQSETLTDLTAKLEAARKAQQDYAKYVADSGRQTPAQTKAMKEQAATVADLEKQLSRAEGRLGTTTNNLKQFGIDATNAAQKQKEIAAAVTLANAALERQDAAIAAADGYNAQARAAEKAAAAAAAKARADQAQVDAAAKAAAALAAQTRAERELAQAEAMRNVQHEADMEALFTREAQKRTDAIKRQADAMRDAAAAAERQMRASATTARGNSPVSTPTVSARLTDIAQPAQAALRDVDALTSSITDLTNKVNAINGPVKNYREVLQQAQQAQRALADMGGLLDSYNRQIATLREARAEYSQARAAVNALIAQMRAGAGGDDITTRLARAQNTLERAATGLGNITTQARTTQAALRQAGIDTRNLGDAEQRLVEQATRAAGAMNNLTDAYRRNGAAAENAGSSIFRWFGGDGGRTTLSYAQRLRGEVLSLAAGFVGLNASIELAKKTIEAYNLTQATMNRLLVASGGDADLARQEFDYLQAASDRIGVSFTKVAPAYAKLAIAARMAGQTTAQTRYIFEGFATATSRLGLSATESERVFKALEQMFNKGKVSAEELTQQLGDALPGALNLFAKARGVTVQEFTKLMEQGAIGPEIIVSVAKQLQETYGTINGGVSNLSQAQARFENATNNFLNNVAKGGFVEAYQNLLVRLTQFLNDGSADKLAQSLSNGFVVVIDVLEKVVENLDLLKVALEVILALKFISWLSSLPALLRAFSAEVVIVNGVLLTMQARLNAASAAVALSAALGPTGLTGIAVRLAPALIAVGNALLFVARALPVIGAGIVAYQATSAILDKIDDNVRKRVTSAQMAAEKATSEAEKAADNLARKRGTKEEADAQAKYDKLSKIAVDAIKAQGRAEAEAREKNVNLKEVQEAQAARRAAAAAQNGPEFPGETDPSQRNLTALQQQLTREQKKIDRQAQNERLKAAKGDLAARLDLIDQEYDDKREAADRDIKDEKLHAEAIAAINAASLAKQNVERQKYANEQKKAGEAAGKQRTQLAGDIADKLEAIEDDIKKRQAEQDVTEPFETRRLARIKAIGNAYDELEKKIRKQASLDPKAAAANKAQLDVLKEQRQALENVTAHREEALRLEKEFGTLQDIQKTKIDAINASYDNGQISLTKRTEEMNRVIQETGPGIEAAGKKALDFANNARAMLDPAVYEKLVATISNGLAKANVEAATAANSYALTQTQLNTVLDQQAAAIERINTMRRLGMISSEEEAQMLNQQQTEYQAKIIALTDALRQQLQVQRDLGVITEEAYNKQMAAIDQLALSQKNALAFTTQLDETIVNSIANNGVSAFEKLGTEIGKVAVGAESIGEGFRGALSAVGEFFASLLRDIALAIAKQLILNAIASWGGGIGAGAVKLGGVVAGGNHNGGVVGRTSSFKREVNPAIFAGAQRFHDGGLPGLRADEVPTILQKGEEVLRKSDPRNVMNGGGLGGGGTEGGAGNRFVLVDDRSKVAEAMQTAEGEKVTLVHLRRNISTLKQWLK